MVKILVVDDNEQSVNLLKDVLETWGCEVDIARQGLEVLPITLRFKPDIILLDIMLPGLSGFEVCAGLRRNEQTKLLPIVMCSALNSPEDIAHAYSVGADNFLVKPINYNILKHITKGLVNRKDYTDNMESRMEVSKILLDITGTGTPQLRERNKEISRLCRQFAAKSDLSFDLDKVLITANLLGVTENFDMQDYSFLNRLSCADWLVYLLKELESANNQESLPERIKRLNDKGIYKEWQILHVAMLYMREVERGKIPRKLIIDAHANQLVRDGCEYKMVDVYKKIFAGEDLLSRIKGSDMR